MSSPDTRRAIEITPAAGTNQRIRAATSRSVQRGLNSHWATGMARSRHFDDEVPLSRMLTMEYSEKQIAPNPASTRAPMNRFELSTAP